jgi:DNA-binding LytR/AlgR family response regulator
MKISVALIDDEPYALLRVKKLLQIDEEIEVVGEASGVDDAFKLLSLHRPEILFLDIKMPDGTGFELLSRLDAAYNPYIVFITAFDNYAIKSFEHNVVDYMLKPFDKSRFFKALTKAKEVINQKRSSQINKQIADLINDQKKQYRDDHSTQIKIADKGWDIFVDHADIVIFEAHGNYCKIHLAKKFYLHKKTMKELKEELTNFEFLRVHRSYILNIHQIRNVKYLGKNEYEFEMTNSLKVNSGRSFAPIIKKYLSLKISAGS